MTIKQNSFVVFTGFFLAVFGLACSAAYAHPFHTTTAEMEFNSSTGRFEVALKIPAMDFEHIVRGGAALVEAERNKQEKDTIHLGKVKGARLEQLAAKYLEKHFVVTMAGKACHLEWIGAEDDATSKWLYFELVLPIESVPSGQPTLTNKVLCDHNLGQINTVVVISKTSRVSLKTHEQSMDVVLPRIE